MRNRHRSHYNQKHMKRYELSWFNDFTCLCNDCPNSCCKGWVIPLSPEDIGRLKAEKGWLGIRLFFATSGWSMAKFNKKSLSCSFWGKDGLCMLQKRNGHDHIPWTCQSFPRFYRNYGEFEECCLDLSCPGAARLFLANNGRIDLAEREADPVTKQCTTNDDSTLFSYLYSLRDQLMQRSYDVFEKGDITVCGRFTDSLFETAVRLQDHYAKGNDTIPDLSLEDQTDEPGSGIPYSFPISGDVLEAFLASSLNHFRLKVVSPALYDMFKKASKLLERCQKTGDGYHGIACSFLTANPQLLSVLGKYLSYYLFQYFLRTYETYSFRRQIALGLCHMNMILLLVIAVSGDDPVSDDVLERVISVYNRRAFFNDGIQDEMYRIFETHYKLHK